MLEIDTHRWAFLIPPNEVGCMDFTYCHWAWLKAKFSGMLVMMRLLLNNFINVFFFSLFLSLSS